jgi:hypothetical protein
VGEAKRRQQSDSTFGRVPKSAGQRGIVIAPGFKSLGPTAFAFEAAEIPPMLRHCLLYWDRIEWPNNNIMSTGDGPDTDYLISAGVLHRMPVQFGGFSGDFTPLLAQGQLRVFEHMEKMEPGLWSLAQSGDRLMFPGQAVPEERAFEVQLYEALPSVAEGTPYDVILEFRERYRSELLVLRAHLDNLSMNLTSASDINKMKVILTDQLAAAISDVERALRGRNLPVFKSSMSLDFRIGDIARQAFWTGAAAELFGVPLEIGAALGATFGLVKCNITPVPTPAAVVKSGPFAYLYMVGKELQT